MLDENDQPFAVQIPIEEFEQLEEIIEKTEKLPALHSVVGQQVELSEELMLANMRAEEVSERFAFTMIRSMAFMDSPKMAAAMQRLDRTMAGMP